MSESDPVEHPPSCGDLVGLLAEPTRRAVFAALVLGPAGTAGAVAERAGLDPKDAVKALRKLVDGRLATESDGGYTVLAETFRRAVQAEARLAGGGDGAGRYFRRGRITAIPGDAAVRARVLAVVAEVFTPGEVYSEPLVNALCGEWFDDWVSLRRALVDERLLRRDHTGTAYQRA